MGVISVDANDFRDFQRTLKKLDKDVARELNKELRKVLNATIIPDARANASWSTRIPPAIKPTVGTTKIGARVASRQAPHGRVFEGSRKNQRNGWFRHPVFGNRERWVNQRVRTFLQPAFDDNAGKATRQAEEAIDRAARAAGFK